MKNYQRWAEQKPRYVHDCNKCAWLGTYKEFDLYACGHFDTDGLLSVDTVIARNSSEPGDYESGVIGAFVRHGTEVHPLRVAMARVVYMDGRFNVSPTIRIMAWDYLVAPMLKEVAILNPE